MKTCTEEELLAQIEAVEKVELKTCARCLETKLRTDFYKYKATKDGLQSYCKKCAKKQQAELYATPEGKAKMQKCSRKYSKKIRATPEGRAKANEAALKWAKDNPDKANAKVVKHKAQKLQATPKWADADKILFFYTATKLTEELTGEKYHVDHIVPLQHPLVCGLHCQDNLQILSASENQSKNNRFKV